MKCRHVFVLASPIMVAIAKKLIQQMAIQPEDMIIVLVRGVNAEFGEVKTISCKDESILSLVGPCSGLIDEILPSNLSADIYIGHSAVLFGEALYRLPSVRKVNYIEEGIGTIAAIIDHVKGTTCLQYIHGFNILNAQAMTVKKRVILGLARIPYAHRIIDRFLSFFADYRLHRIFLYLLKIKRRMQPLDFFKFNHARTGKFFMVTPVLDFKEQLVLDIFGKKEISTKKELLVLMPPFFSLTQARLDLFLDVLWSIKQQLPDFIMKYKLHPADQGSSAKEIIEKKFGPAFSMLELIQTSEETVYWAYKAGFKGIVSVNSTASHYAALIRQRDPEFISLDLTRRLQGIPSFTDYLNDYTRLFDVSMLMECENELVTLLQGAKFPRLQS